MDVRYDPLDAPVGNARVSVVGSAEHPSSSSLLTDQTGSVQFKDLEPGTYQITATYEGKNDIADLARSKIGSTDWAFASERPPFEERTNKCNLFVYEIVTGAGYPVPMRPHEKLWGLGPTVMLPPNAGDWASRSYSIPKSTIVSLPEPGDIAAWSHQFGNATGHVAIVTYPTPSEPKEQALEPGSEANVRLTMKRQVTGANEDTVDEDTIHFWHYYREGNTEEIGKILYRRMSK